MAIPRFFTISIERSEDLHAAIQKIFRETQLRGWNVWEPPQSPMTNFKVLKLVSVANRSVVCKVDGPGFIIDDIYKYFSTKH